MSVFDRVISSQSEAKAKAEEESKLAVLAQKTAESKFATEFRNQIDSTAKPVFEQFVQDAKPHGYHAFIEQAKDPKGNPTYSVHVILAKGGEFGYGAEDEVIFTLRGIIQEQKVEHISCFTSRQGRGGRTAIYGIQSINRKVLEQELEEHLSAAISARAA